MNNEAIKRELSGARLQLHEACAVLKLIEYAEGTSSTAPLVTAAGGAHRLIDEVTETLEHLEQLELSVDGEVQS